MSNYSVFLSNRDNYLKPTKEFKKALQTEINDAKNSCQAISRVVHPAAYGRWTPDADKALLASFKKHQGVDYYALRTVASRSKLVEDIASEVKRSPIAVRDRLYKLSAIKKKAAVKDLLVNAVQLASRAKNS